MESVPDAYPPGLSDAVLLAPRFCPLRCGAQVIGKRYEYHINEECPNRRSLCPEGCGERVLGSEMAEHRAACPMAVLLSRAEAAIRESSMREFRLAHDGVYEEREKARARTRARGEVEDWGRKGWPSRRCEIRIKAIEGESRALVQRSRRRAVEHLTAAIAASGAEPTLGSAEKEGGPVNALKYWDAFHTQGIERGGRPWDLDTPALPRLLDALEEAAVAGADIVLRRRGESMLLNLLRRVVDTAMLTEDDRHRVLEDALDRVNRSLRYLELLDPGDLAFVLEEARVEAHKATLRELPSSTPEFFQALADGDVDLCGWLLERERANPCLPEPRSRLPPLVLAAKNGDVPMCRLLIEYHASVDARCTADGCSALHWAAHNRFFRVLSTLLEGKANPRLQDKRGQDALMKLVRRDFPGPAPGCSCDWEVQRGRRLPGPRLPTSGVMDLESAKAAAETDPDCVGFCFRAALEGRGRCRMVLRAAGSWGPPEVEEVPGSPKSAASAAAEEETLSRERLLEMEEEAEDEALWVSYLKVDTDPVHDVRALVAAGADPGAADGSGLTALHHHLRNAPSRGDVPVVAALLRGGADVNARDLTEHSTTPLLMAVHAKKADLVRLMLDEAFPPADVDSREADGTSALALAESLGAHQVARILRDAGASAWIESEVRLGARTTFSYDSRAPPVPA